MHECMNNLPRGHYTKVDLDRHTGPRNHVLDGGPDLHIRRGNFDGVKWAIPASQDMSGGGHTQSDSAGGRIGMVRMPIEVY